MNIKTTAWNRTLLVGVFALIVLMPFHAFLVTWLSTVVTTYFIHAWKEVLLLLLLAISVGVIWRYPEVRLLLARSKLVWVIIVYSLLHLVLIAAMSNPPAAEILGVTYNLRFLVAFIVALVAGYFIAQRPKFEDQLIMVLLITGGVVAGFAVIQAWLLPADWLAQFGYGPNTILPYQPIQDSEVTRVISTLGGPNQLGSFLLLPLALALYLGIKRRNWWYSPLIILFLLAMFFSHSRSAWIGAAIAVCLVLYWTLKKNHFWRIATTGFSVLAILSVIVLSNIEKAPFLQAAILHSNYDRAFSASSNVDHMLAITSGAEAIFASPLGRGPGNSGPASYGTVNHLISESYYLQIGVETGLLGLILFVAIMYLVSKQLYQARKISQLAVPLLASFWGVAFFNFLLHGWTDSTTALVWWSVAGLVLWPTLRQTPQPDEA